MLCYERQQGRLRWNLKMSQFIFLMAMLLVASAIDLEPDLEWDPCKIDFEKHGHYFDLSPPSCETRTLTKRGVCEYFSCQSILPKSKQKIGYFRVRTLQRNTDARYTENCQRYPRIPPFVQVLDLSMTERQIIFERDFANVSDLVRVKSLLLVDSSVTIFGVLKRLTNLECVNVDYNRQLQLNSRFLENLLALPTLRRLSARYCYFSHVILPTFSRATNLQSLWLAGNYFQEDTNSYSARYQSALNIRGLDFSGNRMTPALFYLFTSDTMETLDLSSNAFLQFPELCYRYTNEYDAFEKDVILPNLQKLDLSKNQLSTLDIFDLDLSYCLPKLEYLDVSSNLIQEVDARILARCPSLISLYIGFQIVTVRKIVLDCPPSPFIRPCSSLSEFHLENLGELNFDTEEARNSTRRFFRCIPRIEKLFLDGSNFHMIDQESFVDIFGRLRYLHTLSLRRTKLGFVSASALEPFRNLTVLVLPDNAITAIPDGCFDSVIRLSNLDLAGNKITVLSERTLSPSVRAGLKRFDISQNPFICTCELRWFHGWFVSNQALFSASDSEYKCSNFEPKTNLSNFVINLQSCLLSREVNSMIIFSCSLIIILFTSFTLLFRYRWHLRLVLYEAFRGRGEARRLHLEQGNFEFDLFVSYASEDLNWVRRHLMPHLEDRLHLRLCIHDRQFIPGKNIVDNIVDCVESSKKIMMVFSKRFVRSQWCQFELAYCLTHVMEHEDALLIVCVDDVVSCEMTSAMMAVLKTTTYIQWLAQADAVRSFWGRLDIALKEVMPNAEHAL